MATLVIISEGGEGEGGKGEIRFQYNKSLFIKKSCNKAVQVSVCLSVYLRMLGEEHVAVESVALAVQPPPVVHGQVQVALDAPHPERARRGTRSELQYCELLGGLGPDAAAAVSNA